MTVHVVGDVEVSVGGVRITSVMSHALYKRMTRFYRDGQERPVDRRRRQQTSTALSHWRRRKWRRIARATGYSGTMKRWWRRQWRGIDTTHTPVSPPNAAWASGAP